MKVSFVTTVLNEEKTIGKLLNSLLVQSKKPDEIMIVDGGSVDQTVDRVKEFQVNHPTTMIYIIVVKGANRAKGRNEAIKQATGEIIVISDAGCELDKDWLEKIIKPLEDLKVDVVAGYYRAKTKSVFEKCVTPFILVMPNKVNPQNFLPASRSMAIRKSVWQKFGSFPEEFSDNEDFVFANRLKKKGTKIVFVSDAIVDWYPRSNLKDFFAMVYRFARGDAQAGLRYKRVVTIFLRYLLGIFALVYLPLVYLLFGLFAYFSWAIWKNYRYIRHPLAFVYLPLLQVTSDLAVMSGSIKGVVKKLLWDF